MKKNIIPGLYLLFVLSVSLPLRLTAQDFPEKPYPPRLVSDFAGMLKGNEVNSLESKLVAFNDSTSTQIAVVTVSDLNGYEVADYAQRLAEKWGIGQKGLDNGILILVKPRTEGSMGQVSIAPGYGLEGAIPDLICARIIDNEILPAFREGDIYGGLDKASTVLMQLASGEFTADEYGNSGSDTGAIAPFIIFLIFLIIFLLIRSSGGRNQRHLSDKKGLPLWVLLSMMNSGSSSHKGSWGGFSGGRGGGGFGGGGFGGFGGGSFGGGGASGSW